jgi:SRSO17 transposase
MFASENAFLTGSALEALSEWSHVLKTFQTRIGQHFSRSEARNSAFAYLQALLSPVERKNGWQMAEQVGHNNPYRFQHLLGRAQWDADALTTEVRQYVVEHLEADETSLAIDETGFIKQGEHSVGVQVQYCGLTGRLENCQVGVFLAYLSEHGHTLIDRRLYLPQTWATDQTKRKKAGVPETISFATKPRLATDMLQSAFASGVRPSWVVADEVYGKDGKFWWWLEQEHQLQKLLWKLLFPVVAAVEQVLHWSLWQRTHQATARFLRLYIGLCQGKENRSNALLSLRHCDYEYSS